MYHSFATDRRQLGALNRETYRDAEAVTHYRRSAGWTDKGEQAMLLRIADEVRGERVLDVGVGGGRTVPILRMLTAEYTGIDYSPEMVSACREEYPGVDILEGDARELSSFGDATFKLVEFSFNGLDSLDHVDREQALREFYRVLVPGGILLYSTTNLFGPGYGRRPWEWRQLLDAVRRIKSTRRVSVDRAVEALRLAWHRYQNWNHRRPLMEHHGGWAMSVLYSHDFGLILHYTLPSTESAILTDVGFEVETIMDRDGRPVVDDSSTTPWFHVLARKPV